MPQEKKFKYNRNIDSQVAVALAKVFNIKVDRVVKMAHGEVNHVFRVCSGRRNFLARIFQYNAWPESGKLQWIESQLSKRNIPHAKILYYSRSKNFFPYGFMVTEFLDGPNGNQAVKRGKISLSRAFFKTGQILKKIHQIKIEKFGQIKNGRGQNLDFIGGKLKAVKSRIKRLEAAKAIRPGLYASIQKIAKNNLLEFNKYFTPVLNHGDANRENSIYTLKGDWVLVDWDNAYSGIWLEDYAELTYWVDWERKTAHAKRIHTLINKNFFKGYGSFNFTDDNIERIEKVLHVIKSTNMLVYYFFNKKNQKDYKKTLQKLYKLLDVFIK